MAKDPLPSLPFLEGLEGPLVVARHELPVRLNQAVVTVLRVSSDDRLRLLWSDALKLAAADELTALLESKHAVTAAQTLGWHERLLWTDGPGGFRLYAGTGGRTKVEFSDGRRFKRYREYRPICTAGADGLTLRRRWSVRHIRSHDVERVCVWIEADWSKCGVSVRVAGKTTEIMRLRCYFWFEYLFDPAIPDAWEVESDLADCFAIARPLAARLGAPLFEQDMTTLEFALARPLAAPSESPPEPTDAPQAEAGNSTFVPPDPREYVERLVASLAGQARWRMVKYSLIGVLIVLLICLLLWLLDKFN